jgi:hypothetical protein
MTFFFEKINNTISILSQHGSSEVVAGNFGGKKFYLHRRTLR